MSRIFKRSIEAVLRFSDEDLHRYLDLCFDHLIGVMRPEHERMQIIDYIEAIHAEMKRRKDDSRITDCNHSNLATGGSDSGRFVLASQQLRKHRNERS